MKKLFWLSLSLTAVSGMAFGAACPTSPTLTFSQALSNSFSCTLGDKVYYNFTGHSQSDAVDTLSWVGVSPTGPYNSNTPFTIQLNAGGTVGSFYSNFTWGYSVSIDQSVVATTNPGTTATITKLVGSITDTAGSTASQATLQKNTAACVGGGLTVNDTQGLSVGAQCAALPNTTAMTISEVFTYTGTSTAASAITQLQNTVNQAFTSTTGVPEPVSMLLFGSGLLAVGVISRKRLVRR